MNTKKSQGEESPNYKCFPNLNTRLLAKIGEPITMHEKYFGKIPTHEELMEIIGHVMDKIKDRLEYGVDD
jgi:hypothetical protein